MACEIHASGEIDLYFYDELDGDARRALSLHLPSCAECRAALDELRTIQHVLSSRRSVDAPPARDWANDVEPYLKSTQLQQCPSTRRTGTGFRKKLEPRELLLFVEGA